MQIDRTSATLIDRLKDCGDGQAWELFYQIYTPLILSHCMRKGCTHEMARDVLQETLVCLMRKLDGFIYDSDKGRFRGFLILIADSRMKDAFRRRSRYQLVDARDEQEMDYLARAVDAVQGEQMDWDQQFDLQVLRQAIGRVKARVQPNTYASFELSTLGGLSIEEVAEQTGLEVNTVYQHRHRISKLLKDEMATIMRELGEA